MGGTLGKLNIDTDQAAYYPGEWVQGHCNLQCTADVIVQLAGAHIIVQWVGEQQVGSTEPIVVLEGAQQLSLPGHLPDYGKNQCLHMPFAFKLADYLPPSCVLKGARVDYAITATAVLPNHEGIVLKNGKVFTVPPTTATFFILVPPQAPVAVIPEHKWVVPAAAPVVRAFGRSPSGMQRTASRTERSASSNLGPASLVIDVSATNSSTSARPADPFGDALTRADPKSASRSAASLLDYAVRSQSGSNIVTAINSRMSSVPDMASSLGAGNHGANSYFLGFDNAVVITLLQSGRDVISAGGTAEFLLQLENNTNSYITGVGVTLFEYMQAAPGVGLSAASSANSSFAGHFPAMPGASSLASQPSVITAQPSLARSLTSSLTITMGRGPNSSSAKVAIKRKVIANATLTTPIPPGASLAAGSALKLVVSLPKDMVPSFEVTRGYVSAYGFGAEDAILRVSHAWEVQVMGPAVAGGADIGSGGASSSQAVTVGSVPVCVCSKLQSPAPGFGASRSSPMVTS